MSELFNLYPNGLPVHNPQWNVPPAQAHESAWLARLVALEAERDAMRQRAEAAENKLLDVLPAYVAQCAKLLEDNDALRQRAEAAEAEFAAIPVDALVNMLNPGGAVNEDADRIEMWIRELKNSRA